ncbi:hypothetical protein HFO04_32785 [Rhizobium laguerreae]|uniref:hypothetical protein n=1 Tax=Rhizobium laguerreae TaxID=1076926 RepID=UPI001C922909|nr:hypothetical protein [Rhizobium laguerreae]MBY3307509.1 hypothetical protein [Rhizobium laguerreae]
MTRTVEELMIELDAVKGKLDSVLPKLAKARVAYLKNPSDITKTVLEEIQAEAIELQQEYSQLVSLIPAVTGLSRDEVDALTKEVRGTRRTEYRLARESLTRNEIGPTAWIEDYLDAAIERVKSILPPRWLAEEPRYAAQTTSLAFGDGYLSLTKGLRPESEMHPIHRLRQAIYVAEDFLQDQPFYDQFAGCFLVPALTRLAIQEPNLKHVGGEREERLHHLWKGPSGQVDATLFELLTAAGCVEKGREVEFISTTSEKSPDIRCYDPYPLVIECKKQASLSKYEAAEESIMRHLFLLLRIAARRHGLYGTFQLELTLEASLIDADEIVRSLVSQRLLPNPSRRLTYSWGTSAFFPSQRRNPLPGPTRIYSPNMLKVLFGWESDLPTWDGICCSIDARGEPFVDEALEPIALLWRNDSEIALKKRSKAPLNLFSKASLQIPPGEFGIIYVSCVEGTRAKVADMRQDAFADRLQAFEHSAKVRIPISLLVRLYPRCLDHGQPDLIESSVRYLSAEHGDADLFDRFPEMIFTHNDIEDESGEGSR